MVMVHAENHDVIAWMTERLLAGGFTRRPGTTRSATQAAAEGEAHPPGHPPGRVPRRASAGVPRLGRGGHGGHPQAPRPAASGSTARPARSTSSSRLRISTATVWRAPSSAAARRRATHADQEAMWRGLQQRHLPGLLLGPRALPLRRHGGKLPKGERTSFKEIANGVPGLELRLPLLFSEGVLGRADLSLQRLRRPGLDQRRASSTACYPRKGSIAVGADADLAIWDPQRVTSRSATTSCTTSAGYTPYEGRRHQRLAGHRDQPRPRGGRSGRELQRRARQRRSSCPATCPKAPSPSAASPPSSIPRRNFGADLGWS